MANILANMRPTKGTKIKSFGAGGQQYIANLFGGFNISASKENPLFSFRETDGSVPHAATLTNLVEANKIGSTMEFKAVQIGVRIFSTTGKVMTPEQMAAAKMLLASSRITITYGSNETRVGEFTGLHFQSPIDCISGDKEKTALVQSGAQPATGWAKLPEAIGLQANLNIGGTVKFTEDVPAILQGNEQTKYTDANSFGFVVIFAGLKVVKA